VKCIQEVKRVRDPSCQLGRGRKIGHHDRRRIGRDHSLDAKAQQDHEERSTESNNSFKHKIRGKTTKSVSALNVAPPASQGNVKSCTHCEEGDEIGTRQI
jgi:hypothetical protein